MEWVRLRKVRENDKNDLVMQPKDSVNSKLGGGGSVRRKSDSKKTFPPLASLLSVLWQIRSLLLL